MRQYAFSFDACFCLEKDNIKEALSNLPFNKGVYYWFASQKALGILNLHVHSDCIYGTTFNDEKFYLVYIGTGPRNELTKQQNINNSTLRHSIAARLEKPAYALSLRKSTNYFLLENGETELTEFLKSEFWLGICKHDEPWHAEGAVIEQFEPPLNLKYNRKGWHFLSMKQIRRNFQERALKSTYFEHP